MTRLLPLIASGFLWERRPRRDRPSQTTTHRPEGGAPTGIAVLKQHTPKSHRRNTGEQNSNFSGPDLKMFIMSINAKIINHENRKAQFI